MQHMHENIPYVFGNRTDLVFHLLLVKSSMGHQTNGHLGWFSKKN